MESFLEFTNFYRHFIKNFSYIAKPLNKLKEKKDWKWEEEYQEVFREFKKKITSQLVLILSKRKEKFRVKTDTSEHAIWQRTTGYSRNSDKMEIILIRYHWKV